MNLYTNEIPPNFLRFQKVVWEGGALAPSCSTPLNLPMGIILYLI